MGSMDYSELFEEYKEMVSKYCIVIADVEIREDDGTFFFDCNLSDCCYIRAGDFTTDHNVIEAIKDFEFEGINKEGLWQISFLLKYNRGDEEEGAYFETLLTEAVFCITFKEKEQQDKDLLDFDSIFKPQHP